jgi:anti-anti-sigma factor
MSTRGLDVNTVLTATRCSIGAAGEIDHGTAERLLTAFDAADGRAASKLVLDLARVTFLDSAGLRTVIDIQRRAQERGLSLEIIPPSGHVRFSGADRYQRLTNQPARGSPELDYPEPVELELPVGAGAPGEARREVSEATAGKLSRRRSEVAVLLASELVTNAVVHPEHRDNDSIGLRINAGDGRARVEVADSGAGFDPTVPSMNKAAGGRGLTIVDRSAVRWGTSRDDRFRVWFEIS